MMDVIMVLIPLYVGLRLRRTWNEKEELFCSGITTESHVFGVVESVASEVYRSTPSRPVCSACERLLLVSRHAAS